MLANRTGASPPVMVHVHPLPHPETQFAVWPVAALVLIVDPAHRTTVDPTLIATTLGLSPMQSQVARCTWPKAWRARNRREDGPQDQHHPHPRQEHVRQARALAPGGARAPGEVSRQGCRSSGAEDEKRCRQRQRRPSSREVPKLRNRCHRGVHPKVASALTTGSARARRTCTWPERIRKERGQEDLLAKLPGWPPTSTLANAEPKATPRCRGHTPLSDDPPHAGGYTDARARPILPPEGDPGMSDRGLFDRIVASWHEPALVLGVVLVPGTEAVWARTTV